MIITIANAHMANSTAVLARRHPVRRGFMPGPEASAWSPAFAILNPRTKFFIVPAQ
jgi:hypothetical protein